MGSVRRVVALAAVMVAVFMALLASFKVLLSVHANQTDFAVGSGIAARDRAELQGVLGLFLNTVALRTDLSGDPTLSEILASSGAVLPK